MFVSHREILNFVKFDQDTRYWQTHSTRYQRNIVSLFNSRWHDRDPLEQTLPIPCISSFQPFPPILFLPRFVFFSPLPRSFRSFASYRIQYTRYVCRSISCIVPGRVGWLRRAYRPRMKKEVRRNSSRQSFFDHLKCAPCGWSILERKKKGIRLLFLIIAI